MPGADRLLPDRHRRPPADVPGSATATATAGAAAAAAAAAAPRSGERERLLRSAGRRQPAMRGPARRRTAMRSCARAMQYPARVSHPARVIRKFRRIAEAQACLEAQKICEPLFYPSPCHPRYGPLISSVLPDVRLAPLHGGLVTPAPGSAAPYVAFEALPRRGQPDMGAQLTVSSPAHSMFRDAHQDCGRDRQDADSRGSFPHGIADLCATSTTLAVSTGVAREPVRAMSRHPHGR